MDMPVVRAYGGTADVVAYAREQGTPVHVIWPEPPACPARQGQHRFSTRSGNDGKQPALIGQTGHKGTPPGPWA